jgi:hypothetical protein
MKTKWMGTPADQLRSFGELFDITARRHKGNPQSVAAFSVVKERISASQERVLASIKAASAGMTCDELAVQFNATPNEISGRCSELLRDGRIKREGRRATRSGCMAAVLKAI